MSPLGDEKIMWMMVAGAILLLIILTLVLFRWL